MVPFVEILSCDANQGELSLILPQLHGVITVLKLLVRQRENNLTTYGIILVIINLRKMIKNKDTKSRASDLCNRKYQLDSALLSTLTKLKRFPYINITPQCHQKYPSVKREEIYCPEHFHEYSQHIASRPQSSVCDISKIAGLLEINGQEKMYILHLTDTRWIDVEDR